jgi:hypothetical protein
LNIIFTWETARQDLVSIAKRIDHDARSRFSSQMMRFPFFTASYVLDFVRPANNFV